ncbi:hypothetical protein [Clostridium botulinum]|uniref:hypothetical protein n=1 Tax=Clostridium TaxID=1485 RepID=UPI0012B6ABD4|nr:hypothetical protein [Clostridium botulinum]
MLNNILKNTDINVIKDILQILVSFLTIISLGKNLLPKKKKNKKRSPKRKRK